MKLCAQLPLIWYATWLLSEKDIVWPIDPTPWVWQNICYHVAASVVSFNLICNLTTFRKIYSLTVWPHPLGQGCVCGQNIRYNVAASIVSYNLIYNMTIFWKSLILASAPPPKSAQRTRTQAFKLKFHLICFISIAVLPACKISAKNINNCFSYCENKIFDLWSFRWDQRGGVKLWHCHAYLQALDNHGLLWEVVKYKSFDEMHKKAHIGFGL